MQSHHNKINGLAKVSAVYTAAWLTGVFFMRNIMGLPHCPENRLFLASCLFYSCVSVQFL